MILSHQLLLNETPELEAQRREALEREERLSGERDAARLDLLSQLATARGQDLLQESQEQGGLLSTLEATQSKAKEIAIALEESRQSLNEVSKYFQKFQHYFYLKIFILMSVAISEDDVVSVLFLDVPKITKNSRSSPLMFTRLSKD